MDEIVVPIDLTAEEKTVLAVLSIRQFLLVVPAGVFSIIQLLLFNLPFVQGWADFLIRLFFFFCINGLTSVLAFLPMERRDQYLSEFITTKIQFLRSQKVYTN